MTAAHRREPRAPILLAGACAAGFGLGLARTLFEWQPQRFDWLAGWPGTLVVVAAVAVAAVRIERRPDGAQGWRALPLALPLLHAAAPNVDLLRGWTLLAGALALYGLLIWQTGKPDWLVTSTARDRRVGQDVRQERVLTGLLFIAVLLLYLQTLAPAVGEADTFEFQVGIARLGVAHGSGYPLLMLVGKLFSLLPLGGTLAWRANLTSAFFGAVAAVVTARLTRRLGAGPIAATVAGLTFGVSPTLWSRAVEVEAYTLNAALVAAILYLAVDIIRTGASQRIKWLGLLFGLSLANHLTTLLLAPALLAAAAGWAIKGKSIGTDERAIARSAAGAGLAILLGLAVYVYIPLRWPAVNDGQRLSAPQFVNILSGNEAKGAFQWDLPWRDQGRYGIVADKMRREYGWAGAAALAYGAGGLGLAAWRARQHRRDEAMAKSKAAGSPASGAQLILLGLAYVPYLYFALAFNVPDPDFSAFFIPLHLITAVLMGLAWQTLATAAGSLPASNPLAAAAPYVLLTAFSWLPLSTIWRTLPRVDQSADWARYQLGQQILQQPLAENATILADSQKIAPLYYLQTAEGVRPDLDIVVLPDEASYRAVLDERIAQGRTVYLGRYLPGLGGGYTLRSIGPLAEVAVEPWSAAPVTLQPPMEQPEVPGLRLLGAAIEAGGSDAADLGEAAITLAWQSEAGVDDHLLVSLQLVNGSGEVAWRGPGRVPVGGLYPTNAWRAGEVVGDYYTIPLAPDLRPGRYRLQVGLFPPFAVTEAGWTDVTEVTVAAPLEPAEPSRPMRARFGDQWLLGYDLPESAAPGALVEVTLYWLRSGESPQQVTAFGETRSLDDWPPGHTAVQVYSLRAPTEADSFDLAPVIETGEPARCGWLQPKRPNCLLPPVQLTGQAIADGAFNFDNRLLLTQADLITRQAAPGERVQVTLQWQGLRRIGEDYTVFVHLLGPDGRVHGQVDAWPVSGTRATSGWEPGERIHDPYNVTVPVDAPPGEYQVEIGLYLLATGQRVPVLNEAGEAVDDRILLDGLVVGAP